MKNIMLKFFESLKTFFQKSFQESKREKPSKSCYNVFFPLVCLSLLVVHGLESVIKFRIDHVTVILLVLAVLPFAAEFFEGIKAGDWEIKFRSLSPSEQSLFFLHEFGRGITWTFYESRENETSTGKALRVIVEGLMQQNKTRLMAEIGEWLKSDDDNLRWLGSEIIGYFMLSEFKDTLYSMYKDFGENIDVKWPTWKLNCLWAHSRFDNYQEIHDFLFKTHNSDNQKWLLFVYEQMPIAGHAKPGEFIGFIETFLTRTNIDLGVRQQAEHILSKLRASSKQLLVE